jgi:DNA polymerase-3 subunit delta
VRPAKADGESKEALAAWLVMGEDPSLVGEAVSRLVSQLVGGAERSLVVEDYSGEDVDLAAVAAGCRTPPFLAEHRVVVVRDAGRFSSEQVSPLVSYLEEGALPTTKLVVAAGGGQLAPKLVSAFKSHGSAQVVTTDVSPKEAPRWLAERLSVTPVKLTPPAVALVGQHLGEDLGRLSSLIAVLEAAYGRGARVGPKELEPYLGQPGSVPPWDLTDAIDKGDAERALVLLRRLLAAGDRHPLVVHAILHRHFANILRVQSPLVTSEAEAAEALGIQKGRSTFPAKKALDAARRLGAARAGDAILALAEAELALKGKLEWGPELVLEVLVARLCRLSRAGRAGRA